MRSDTAILIHIKSIKLYVLHRLNHVLFKRGRNPDVGKITAMGRIGDLCIYKQGTEHARVFAEKEFCRWSGVLRRMAGKAANRVNWLHNLCSISDRGIAMNKIKMK